MKSKIIESKSFNITHRLLHWSIGITIIILTVTALLHISWLSNNNMAKTIQENLQLFGIQISFADATIITQRLLEPKWEWHFYAGYVFVGLYVLRMIHLAIYGIHFPSPLDSRNTLKQRFQGLVYIGFYVLLGVTVVTGVLMLWGPTSWRWTSQIIHYQSHYYAIAFVLVHMAGITVTEVFMEKGVASSMIHGEKPKSK